MKGQQFFFTSDKRYEDTDHVCHPELFCFNENSLPLSNSPKFFCVLDFKQWPVNQYIQNNLLSKNDVPSDVVTSCLHIILHMIYSRMWHNSSAFNLIRLPMSNKSIFVIISDSWPDIWSSFTELQKNSLKIITSLICTFHVIIHSIEFNWILQNFLQWLLTRYRSSISKQIGLRN